MATDFIVTAFVQTAKLISKTPYYGTILFLKTLALYVT